MERTLDQLTHEKGIAGRSFEIPCDAKERRARADSGLEFDAATYALSVVRQAVGRIIPAGRWRPQSTRRMLAPVEQADRAYVSAEEFGALFQAVSAWGRWGADDERGALNHLTPERVLEAARSGARGDLGHAQPAARHNSQLSTTRSRRITA